METKTNGFDFVNLQKQFIDSAMDASKNWMNFSQKNDFQNLMTDWISQMSNSSNWQNLANVTPEQVKQWVEMQMSFYSKMAEMFNINPANSSNDFFKVFTDKSYMPFNLSSSFDFMKSNWDKIAKSIKFDLSDTNAIDHFFSNDVLKEHIGKMMGFNMINNIKAPIKEVETYFGNVVGSLKNSGNQLKDIFEQAKQAGVPSFNNMYGMNLVDNITQMLNQSINTNFMSLSKLFPMQDRDEIIEAVKNIQFSYMSFLYKSYAMQMMLAEKGSPAMQETIKMFSDSYAKDGSLPDYETFFGKYIGILEAKLTEALNTKEFSVVQAEVANAMVNSKKQVEILKELLFKELPFVKYAEFDDLLLEISTLRKKNRQLESRLRAIEEKLNKPETKAKAPKTAII